MVRELQPKDLRENVFSLLDDRWTLITAGDQGHCNTMTASWGGLGVLWNKNVATIYVRPQRYTFEFLEAAPCFTLSFFGEEWKKALAYCGRVSGREADKFSHCGFHVDMAGEHAPYIREADMVLVCRKLYWNDLEAAHMDPVALEHYEKQDYHRMYIGEITKILVKE
ncbi:MAG: flavin reductase family protein [Ruminiclostridium sp.]|nr:flavin reductase family protein [Ruminiclostridium sp.]